MKETTTLKALLTLALITFFSLTGISQLLLEENFDYPSGDLLTDHGWTAHSGGGTQPVTVNAGGLNFTGYPGTGTGNAALLDNNGEDVNHVFPAQTAGTVFVSFMVNVTTTAAGYFLHLGGDPIGTTFRGKVFMDASNHFGLSMGSNTGTFATATYNPGTTYVLVLKYEVVSGTTNDIVSLFIFDSALPSSEPATPAVGPLTDPAMSDINPGAIALRQFLATQNLLIDGIRVGMSWGDILPASITPPTVQAQDIAFSNITSSAMSATWTNGNGAKRVTLMNTSNSFTDPVNGTDPAANPVYSGSGQQVIFNGAGNTVNVSGLTGSTTYWYRVYEYNGSGSGTQYLTLTAPLNPNSQSTSTSLTVPAISLPSVTSVGSGQATLGATVTSNGGTPLTERGTVWKAAPGVTMSDNKLAEGGTATGVFAHTRAGLPAQTQIWYRAFASNIIGTSLTDEDNFFTLSTEPSAHVTGFTANPAGNTSINLSWTQPSPGAAAYLIIMRPGASPAAAAPSDATAYLEGEILGDGIVAAIVTPGSTLNQTITGLSSGTAYSFTLFPYAWDGANSLTCNYLTAPVVPSATATTTGTPPVVYTWQGANNGSWTVASNWSPARTSPSPADILIFNDGTTKTVTGLTTQTIARLQVTGNTTVNLQAPSVSTLTIAGASGTDLEIGTGCALNLNATNAITINLPTTATASISGSMRFSATANTGHRLTAADPGAIVFGDGATFTAGTFFSGNPFGTTYLGSVVFTSGSAYIQQAGSNPFGAAQPNSVVVFQAGSLFKVMANLTPSFSGRSYANFEMDAPGITLSPSGSNPVAIDNLTITNGTFNFNMTGPLSGAHSIHGDITVQSGAILNFNPSSAATITLQGAALQNITINGTFTANTNANFKIAGPGGVSLNSDIAFNGNLELAGGILHLGAANLTLSTTSVITGTPSASTMIAATGTGQLRKTFPAGFTGSYIFPVGDATGTPGYSPVTLNFTAGTFDPGNWTGVSLSNEKFPGDPNTTSYLNRYWNVGSSGITGFTCNAVFQYDPSDVSGTEDQIFSMQMIPAPFTSFGLVNSGLHQVTAPGLTAFGTFTGSQPAPSVITLPASLIGATTATLNGEIIANYNATSVTFDYGLTSAYGTTVPATPSSVTGGGTNSALANITSLSPNTTYHFRVNGTNVQGTTHGNDLTFTTTCPVPSGAGAISGPDSVCLSGSGYVFTVPPVTNATNYNWTLPPGATITAGSGTNSITVAFSGSAVSGSVSVSGNSVCGTGTPSQPYQVTVVAPPVPVISGPASACVNSQGNVYSTETGMTAYQWTLSPGGTITSGSSTNSITVTWTTTGPKTVTVTYTNATGCAPVTPATYVVNVENLPVPVITGPAVVCANAANIVYTTEPGMTSYNWAVSIGGFIVSGAGTNSITVSWPYAGNRTVSVSYATPTGCLAVNPSVFNVTVNPAAVPVIGSSNDPCLNSSNNQYITNSGMTNYTWAVSPGGTITSGSGTNTIAVTWNDLGPQWVSVGFTNSYGCTTVTPTVYNLFVNPPPSPAGPVTGTAQLCAGATGILYSCNEINNASSYAWSLPAGASITAGAGTSQITVSFAPGAVSGNITVAGTNGCGTGTPSPAFPVTVNPIPPAPVVTATGAMLNSSSPNGNQWYYQGNIIPGATGQTYTASAGTGYYWTVVTLNGCTSPPSNQVWVVMTGTDEKPDAGFSIFPIPNDGVFNLTIDHAGGRTWSLQVVSSLGTQVFEESGIRGEFLSGKRIDLGEIPAGIYTAILTGGDRPLVRKFVVTR